MDRAKGTEDLVVNPNGAIIRLPRVCRPDNLLGPSGGVRVPASSDTGQDGRTLDTAFGRRQGLHRVGKNIRSDLVPERAGGASTGATDRAGETIRAQAFKGSAVFQCYPLHDCAREMGPVMPQSCAYEGSPGKVAAEGAFPE